MQIFIRQATGKDSYKEEIVDIPDDRLEAFWEDFGESNSPNYPRIDLPVGCLRREAANIELTLGQPVESLEQYHQLLQERIKKEED